MKKILLLGGLIGLAFAITNNTTFSSTPSGNLPTGTYISYIGGSKTAFNTLSNITRSEAATNCKIDKNKNPGKSIRCTWPNKTIVKNTTNNTVSSGNGTNAQNTTGVSTISTSANKLNLTVDKTTAKVGESVIFSYDIGSDYKACSLHISVGKTGWGTFGLNGSNKIYDYYNGPKDPVGKKEFKIDQTYLRDTGKVVLLLDCYNSANQKNERKELVINTKTETITPLTCPVYSMAAPAPGCKYIDGTKDANGCSKPQLVCENTNTGSITKGLYKGYLGDSTTPFITTQNITKDEALANCKTNSTNNPTKSIRCTWNDIEIFSYKPTTTTTTTTTTPTCVDLQYEFQCTQAMNGKYKQLKFANGNTENITAISDCTSTTFSYMTSSSATSWNGQIGAGWKACSSAPITTTTTTTQNPVTASASVTTRLYGVPAGANGYSITRWAKIHGDYVFSPYASNVSCQVWYSKNAANSLGDFINFAIENWQSNTSSKLIDAFDIDTSSVNADANSLTIQSKCGWFVNGGYTNVIDRQVVALITRKPVIEYFRLVASSDETIIEWSATDTSAELCTLKKSSPTGAVQFQVAYPAKNTFRELKSNSVGAIYQLSCPNKNGTTNSENITIPGGTTSAPPVVANNSIPSISVDTASAIAGSTVTFSWKANGGTQCYTSVNGNVTGQVSGSYGNIPVTNAPAGTYSATLSCSFDGSIRTSTPVRVVVTTPAVVAPTPVTVVTPTPAVPTLPSKSTYAVCVKCNWYNEAWKCTNDGGIVERCANVELFSCSLNELFQTFSVPVQDQKYWSMNSCSKI